MRHSQFLIHIFFWQKCNPRYEIIFCERKRPFLKLSLWFSDFKISQFTWKFVLSMLKNYLLYDTEYAIWVILTSKSTYVKWRKLLLSFFFNFFVPYIWNRIKQRFTDSNWRKSHFCDLITVIMSLAIFVQYHTVPYCRTCFLSVWTLSIYWHIKCCKYVQLHEHIFLNLSKFILSNDRIYGCASVRKYSWNYYEE